MLAWARAATGAPTYGIGLMQTSESSVAFAVNGQMYMGTASGVYNISGMSVSTFGYWTSITGIPIINSTAAAGGAGGLGLLLPKCPCLSQAIQAFGAGWKPW